MSHLNLQPSPLDRLDPIAQGIRWWLAQMQGLFGSARHTIVPATDLDQTKARLPRRVVIELAETDAFSARTVLPKARVGAHQRALELRLPELAPISPDELAVFATAIEVGDEGTTYHVAMARSDRLKDLEAAAKRRGAAVIRFNAAGDHGLDILSARGQVRARRRLVLDAAIIVGLIFSAVAATNLWAARIAADTEALADRERLARRAAVATEATRKQGEVSRQLVERGILKRRGSAVLDTLAALNAATPDNTWWTFVRWSPDETVISGQGANATDAIGMLSANAKDWSVELAGPLASAPPGGAQSFEIVARPRKAAKP